MRTLILFSLLVLLVLPIKAQSVKNDSLMQIFKKYFPDYGDNLVNELSFKLYLDKKFFEFSTNIYSYEEYQKIQNLNIWKELDVVIVPDYEQDCRGYSFKIEKESPLKKEELLQILLKLYFLKH